MNDTRKDVTSLVRFGLPDGECLPLYRCVCGEEFRPWDVVISMEDHGTWADCFKCGRSFEFSIGITVYEVGRAQGKGASE